jgi:hypothetical protein
MTDTGHGVIYLHRLLLNAKLGQRIIHLDNDGLNNQRSNLCLHLNSGCRLKARTYANKKPTSEFKGVYVSTCIRAQLYVNRRKLQLGSFKSQEAAAKFRDHVARLALHKPTLNFPDVIDEDLLREAEQYLASRGIAIPDKRENKP